MQLGDGVFFPQKVSTFPSCPPMSPNVPQCSPMSADVPRCQGITSEGKQVLCLREEQLGHGWTCLDIVSERNYNRKKIISDVVARSRLAGVVGGKGVCAADAANRW